MFDLLKKKLGKFTENVKKKLDQKEETFAKKQKEIPEPKGSQAEEPKIAEPASKTKQAAQKESPLKEPEPKVEAQKPEEKVPEAEEPLIEEETLKQEKPIEEALLPEEAIPKAETQQPEKPEEILEEAEPEEEIAEPEGLEKGPKEAKAPQTEEPEEALEEPAAKPAEEKPRLKPKISIRGKLKSAITGKVELEEKDLESLLEELELALLEADVEQTTAEEICGKIGQRLVGKKLPRGKSLEELVKKEISSILLEMMKTKEFDLVKAIKEKGEKPYRILFLGPNGAGKTTSIAKLTFFLQNQGFKVLWAAGDTFRAASIEQLEKHAERLKVRVVKHQYGADPAAVAFDAVKSAKSKGIDVVLIDSAGRQETNRNLMGELEKIARVAQPDLKIYVGEAFTGQSLLQQAKEYNKTVGIDGFILSKIDCDSKGGTTISLLYKIGNPILFVGTGQEYKDLEKFEPEFVLKRIIG